MIQSIKARLKQTIIRRWVNREDYAVDFAFGQGYLDGVSIEPNGVIQLTGWHQDPLSMEIAPPQCFINDDQLPVVDVFRTYRADIALQLASDDYFYGIVIRYRLDKPISMDRAELRLVIEGETIFKLTKIINTITPHYAPLLATPDVLQRHQIYGSGPPANVAHHEVIALTKNLPGPVLDFGCGSGALLKSLRAQNIDAYGLELNRDQIINHISPDIRDRVIFYSGRYPLPFKAGQFQSVTAIEVIEHIPDYEAALQEIARITRDRFIITVPDMSAIPMLYPYNVVPWHLLESTHVNFFTQLSLETTLRRYFSSVKFARVGLVETNRTKWFVSLVGVCQK